MPARLTSRQWSLVALLVILAAVLAYQVPGRNRDCTGERSGVEARGSRPRGRRQGPRRIGAGAAVGGPGRREGGPCRERAQSVPRAAEGAAAPGSRGAAGAAAAGPQCAAAAPPPPPPIALKLLAIVQGSGKPVAALTDGRDVFYGREGDIIEGRYRIVKINVESIDIAYVDGRGQRRLGLTG